jgi:glycosyltransferase involved in cell wall biosynthesis
VWLVGNAPPAEISSLASDTVRVTGRVPDVVPYLDAADIALCPLRIGGGIKVKAIEAVRRGKAIVSTPVGAQGLPSAVRDAIRIAGDAEGFAEATISLLLDHEQRIGLERRAHFAAASLPTWDRAAEALEDVYDALLRQAREHEPVQAEGTA